MYDVVRNLFDQHFNLIKIGSSKLYHEFNRSFITKCINLLLDDNHEVMNLK